jgi:hypothetical protein
MEDFEAANKIKDVSAEDAIFFHDTTKYKALLDAHPWAKESVLSCLCRTDDCSPNYFKSVQISALALLKMVVEYALAVLIGPALARSVRWDAGGHGHHDGSLLHFYVPSCVGSCFWRLHDRSRFVPASS